MGSEGAGSRLAGGGRLALFLAVAGVASALTGCVEGDEVSPSSAPESGGGGLTEAQGLMQAGDFAGAEAILLEVTAETPDSARGWAMLGFAIHSQQRWEEALALHLKAAAFPGGEGQGLFRAGLALVQLGRVDEATREYQYIIDNFPESDYAGYARREIGN